MFQYNFSIFYKITKNNNIIIKCENNINNITLFYRFYYSSCKISKLKLFIIFYSRILDISVLIRCKCSNVINMMMYVAEKG